MKAGNRKEVIMSRRIVILGGGTGGTLTAGRLLRHSVARDASTTV